MAEKNDWCISNRRKFATTLKRLQKAEGVISLLVVNPKGLVWFTTMANALTALRYCRIWKPFCMRTMSLCRNIDTTDDVICVMVTTKKHELLMVPDEEFILIALQKYGPGEKLYPEFAEGVIDAQVKI
ncbi:dynein light chain roadblock-type 2 [Halyomorpha halys]|uniref:dynein light chain roadblock-type 2 n=1 Tax=Halyomorpha halys TaxID=286706 RepID=UPI0006D51A52|nr:dynein light chain roadblock-type 2-like [Halyomorpha halys]